MNRVRKYRNGFTLVEILIVIFLFGIFIGAAYSLYVAHMKTAVAQEEIVDVQQNLRIAMDAISRDVAMGGFLSPAPLNIAFANNSTAISLATATAEKSYLRIIDPVSPLTYRVAPQTALGRFAVNDTVRSINPEGVTQGADSVFTVDAIGSDTVKLKDISAVAPQVGDVLCKIATTAAPFPETIAYSVSSDPALCGTGLKCVIRRVNQDAPLAIAQIGGSKPGDEGHLQFSYLLNDGRELRAITSTDDASALRAIRITLTGQAVRTGEAGKRGAIRRMSSMVRLRNQKGGA